MANNRDQQIRKTLLQFYARPVAKVSLELVFSIVTVLFFALFAIRPTLLTMSDLIKEIDDKKALNQKLEEKIAALTTVQASYISQQSRFAVLDKAISPTPHFDEALTIIERIASDDGITISSLQAKQVPSEPLSDVDFSKKVRLSQAISIALSANYPAVRKFIEDLHKSQRTLIINSVVITASQDRRSLDVTLTIDIPYYGVQTAQP